MKPNFRITLKGGSVALSLILAIGGAILPNLAAAGSAFGCSRLQEYEAGPYFEGKEGFFYRAPDVRLYLPFPARTLDLLAELSETLLAGGTTLIIVPVPSKAQVLPQFVPEEMFARGFDPETANELYDRVIAGMAERGVVAVNLLAAFDTPNPEGPYFHKADFHWSPLAAQAAAMAVAGVLETLPVNAELPKRQFETNLMRTYFFNTPLRQRLQSHCINEIPIVELQEWKTLELEEPVMDVEQAEAVTGLLDLGLGSPETENIFGDPVSRPSVVLVGTSYSAVDQGNFSGWISQYSNLDLLNASITGGNQYGSITSYLTSISFLEEPPHILIWETPIYSNLFYYGEAPMLELIAAASRFCSTELTTQNFGGTGVIADISGLDVGPDTFFLADAGRATFARGTFTFHKEDGQTRSIRPHRKLRGRPTGRFFVPMTALHAFEATQVSIDFSRTVNAGARLFYCNNRN